MQSASQTEGAVTSSYPFRYAVPADRVQSSLKEHMLVDGFDLVLDLDNSQGATIIDSRNGRRFLDFFTCFASMPLGFNHPKLLDPEYVKYMGMIALNKPSNSDIYTEAMATFVKTFFELAVPKHYKYGFFIDGGALAVENALKVAFDWKVLRNFRNGYTTERGHQVIHFRQAFHGRSGYTMSLTNTDPVKTAFYPKFNWPRVHNPAMRFPLTEETLDMVRLEEERSIAEIKRAFRDNKDDIAAIILEPIQGEGGDNHFRPEFLQQLRDICDEEEALLIFDEVQTGVGLTGSMWVHEQLGVYPDIMCFGKKMQTCGIIVSGRVDNEPENVFHTSSRINSTWGGNLVDFMRATRYLEIIHEENLIDQVKASGEYLIEGLHRLQNRFPHHVSNVRGRGLFCAFDMPGGTERGALRRHCFEHNLIILASGEKSVRFRPPLSITREQIDEGLTIIGTALAETVSSNPDTQRF